MAGASDKTYRRICAEFGAAFTVTEMVSSRALMYNYNKTNELTDIRSDIRPVAIQIFGDDPFIMAKAAEKVWKELQPDFIDVNMGCPVPKVAGNNCGAALMKKPDLCGSIVAAMKKAVDIPVTVKIRKGWDANSVNAVQVAQICEAAGADAITVHGRTRAQMYEPSADWSIIKEVKEAVKVPVIGNGDVTGAQSAVNMINETGCDMVMVGRAAMGNPWVFQQINGYLCEETRIMPPPSVPEMIIVIRRHIAEMCAEKGEERAMREARKHVAWYLKGMRNAAKFRGRAGQLSTLAELDELLKDVYMSAYMGEE